MTTHGDECQCENCRTLRAAEKAVLEHGGKEYVPEKKFPSIPYSLVVETLCQRILDLIPAHPEILKVHDVWDLFEVPGFECEDLNPSGAQAGGAFAKAKRLHRQGQTVNPDLITRISRTPQAITVSTGQKTFDATVEKIREMNKEARRERKRCYHDYERNDGTTNTQRYYKACGMEQALCQVLAILEEVQKGEQDEVSG